MKTFCMLFIFVASLTACQKHELVPVPGTTDTKSGKGELVPMPEARKENKTFVPMDVLPTKK